MKHLKNGICKGAHSAACTIIESVYDMVWKNAGLTIPAVGVSSISGVGVGWRLAGGFLRQMGPGLALSQLKTCKSGRVSSMYYEKVMRTSSPGRI